MYDSNIIYIYLIHIFTQRIKMLARRITSVSRKYLRSASTVIGVPKEIKSGENRVGMTPAGVQGRILKISLNNS